MTENKKLQIKEFFLLDKSEKEFWLTKIGESDWRAGKYLFKILSEGSFNQQYGEKSKVFLLTQGNNLISFCSFSERDEIPDTELTP